MNIDARTRSPFDWNTEGQLTAINGKEEGKWRGWNQNHHLHSPHANCPWAPHRVTKTSFILSVAASGSSFPGFRPSGLNGWGKIDKDRAMVVSWSNREEKESPDNHFKPHFHVNWGINYQLTVMFSVTLYCRINHGRLLGTFIILTVVIISRVTFGVVSKSEMKRRKCKRVSLKLKLWPDWSVCGQIMANRPSLPALAHSQYSYSVRNDEYLPLTELVEFSSCWFPQGSIAIFNTCFISYIQPAPPSHFDHSVGGSLIRWASLKWA